MSDNQSSSLSAESTEHAGGASGAEQIQPSASLAQAPSPSLEMAKPNVRSLFGLADALLRAPELVAVELHRDRRKIPLLAGLVVAAIASTGLVVASFTGGWQYLAVPIKLSIVVAVGPLLCLPSLYIFSCLSESRYDFTAVAIALGQGLGVMSLLSCGLMPVAWVFAQSTNSVAFMGFLFVTIFLVSSLFGLGVTSRLLTQGVQPIRFLWLWQLLFVVVILQLLTTLRPIVGPYTSGLHNEKLFFLAHWWQGIVH